VRNPLGDLLMNLFQEIHLPRVKFGIAERIALGITIFGIFAFILHADSPSSAWCWVHIVPLPFLGWLVGDLPMPLIVVAALAQLVLGFVSWALALRGVLWLHAHPETVAQLRASNKLRPGLC
jgi:hypothetical protein